MAMAISEISGVTTALCKGRMGLLGGTFDPVHNGHLAAAQAVRAQLGLDTVLLLPAALPPHKLNYEISSFTHRAAMLEMAVAMEPDISVCLIEQERGGPSYTIDTLINLNASGIPNLEHGSPAQTSSSGAALYLYFIIGIDAFADIHTWKDYRAIPAQAHLVVLNRPGCAVSYAEIMAAYFPNFAYDQSAAAWQAADVPGMIYFLEIPPLNISSSRLRRQVAAGADIRPYVPPVVHDYMMRHRLYR